MKKIKFISDGKNSYAIKENHYCLLANIMDYNEFVYDSDWSKAIENAVNDLSEGGVLLFPSGTYNTKNKFPTNKKITIQGDGCDRSIIKYTGTMSEGAFIDIRISGFSIKNISILGCNGRAGENITSQNCSGIWIREDESGNAVGKQCIENVFIEGFRVDGIKIYSKVWMVFFDKISAYRNDNFGVNISGTDNTYSNILCEGNGVRGISVTGGNNRILNVNCIFNGKNDINGCEGYFSSWHLSLSNVVCQDGFHNGFVFDECKESTIDVISDCCGYSKISGLESEPTAYGVKFIKCKNIIGTVQNTNYRKEKESQLYGIYVDGSCCNLSLRYTDTSLSKKGSIICSNVLNDIKDCNDIMFEKYFVHGNVFNNIISSPDFSDESSIIKFDNISNFSKNDQGIGIVTIDGTSTINRLVQFKDKQVQGNVYYHRISVKTSNEGFSVVLYNNSGMTPSYFNLNKRDVPNDGEWHTFSWLSQNSGTSNKFYITSTYKGEGTGEIQVKEPMCIDLTNDLLMYSSSELEEVTSFDTTFMDKIIDSIGWFSSSKTI